MKSFIDLSGRRSFLQRLAIGFSALPFISFAREVGAEESAGSVPEAGLESSISRFVFLPCLHLRTEPNFRSKEGISHALRVALQLKPDLILTGGDLCQDLRTVPAKIAVERASELKEIFSNVVPSGMSVHHILGNHDAADWVNEFNSSTQQTAFDPLRRVLGIPNEPIDFDHRGWRFIGLHNVSLLPNGNYRGEWGEHQLRWLRNTLVKDRRPTIIFAHMPTVSASDFLGGSAELQTDGWRLPFRRATKDAETFFEIIRGSSVKLVLNGHLHRDEQIEVEGVRFVCAGSVSGAQWTGEQGNTPPGFGVVELFKGGAIRYRYHPHGWQF